MDTFYTLWRSNEISKGIPILQIAIISSCYSITMLHFSVQIPKLLAAYHYQIIVSHSNRECSKNLLIFTSRTGMAGQRKPMACGLEFQSSRKCSLTHTFLYADSSVTLSETLPADSCKFVIQLQKQFSTCTFDSQTPSVAISTVPGDNR